ncbi:hypothetical protein ABW19_dt0201569 [Dactylella cylindrospora]|nr:hypothetical protein ABW19_dt0201569 [Dactylella cylindrospora]
MQSQILPTTPTGSSIRDFQDHTNIPSSLLASTYRRDSHPPSNPNLTSAPTISPVSSSTPTSDLEIETSFGSAPHSENTTFWSHGLGSSRSTLTDISTYLELNDTTPTKARAPLSIRRDAENLEGNVFIDPSSSPLSEFAPIGDFPGSSSVLRNSKRRRIEGSLSPDSRTALLSESFEKLSDSAKRMPNHLAYNVGPGSDREILRMHFEEQQSREPILTLPSEKHDIPGGRKEATGDVEMDIDTDEAISFSDDNKENIDPSMFGASFTPTKSIMAATSQTTPREEKNRFVPAPVKNTLYRKKLEAMKISSGLDVYRTSSQSFSSSSSCPRVSALANTTDIQEATFIPSSTGQSLEVEAPNASKVWNPIKEKLQQTGEPEPPQQPTGLKSKFGALSKQSLRRNPTAEVNINSHLVPVSSDPARTVSTNTTLPSLLPSLPSSLNLKIPPTPLPQKLLHKTAKESSTKIFGAGAGAAHPRSARKLEELKTRFPRNMYENGKKRKDIIELLRKRRDRANGLDEELFEERVDETEWSDPDLMSLEADGVCFGI